MLSDRDQAAWDAIEDVWEAEVERRVSWLEALGLVLIFHRLTTDRMREVERRLWLVEQARANLLAAQRDLHQTLDVADKSARLAVWEGEGWRL